MKSDVFKRISVWDEAAVRHVLSRVLFGYNEDDVVAALTMTMDEFIDNHLLANKATPAPPGPWVVETPVPNNFSVDRSRMREAITWWYNLMRTQGFSVREKLVLFWHNHFVSEFSTVRYPQYMYIQNALFRKYAMGNLIDFTKAVTIDPAMLIYLDGRRNLKQKPNENYARELLELFTMGIGNYTENDIGDAARALTGWIVNGLNAVFVPSRFDNGDKYFLGQIGFFNHEEIIDIIFQQDATALWFCNKLYKEFVFYDPDQAFVEQLADLLRTSQYEVKPVLSTLFKSEYFHSEDIRGAKIKSPVELLISTLNQFFLDDPDYDYIRTVASELQQEIFNPPDVRGWEGQRKWISTNTYPIRNRYTDSILDGKVYTGQNIDMQVDIVDYARSFPSSEDAEQFVEDVTKALIHFPLSTERKAFLLETLLDGSALYEWTTYHVQAYTRIRKFLKALMRLPEYQLS